MRLIDADALKESLKELKAKGNNRRYVQGLQDAIDGYFPQIIDDEPTIDAEPVKHAWWNGVGKVFSDEWTCSNCGHKKGQGSGIDFCGNCGAKMDGGKSE